MGSGEGVPLLEQEGWTRDQKNAAKPPLKARPGWSVRRNISRERPPPSAPLRNGIFFLMAQPPLLFQEGNTLAHDLRSLKKNSVKKPCSYSMMRAVLMY